MAVAATNAALNGNIEEFQAAAAALDENSVDLAEANGAAYGSEAEEAFLPLWRKHIGFVVDYTTGLATDDTAKQEKAVNDQTRTKIAVYAVTRWKRAKPCRF